MLIIVIDRIYPTISTTTTTTNNNNNNNNYNNNLSITLVVNLSIALDVFDIF